MGAQLSAFTASQCIHMHTHTITQNRKCLMFNCDSSFKQKSTHCEGSTMKKLFSVFTVFIYLFIYFSKTKKPFSCLQSASTFVPLCEYDYNIFQQKKAQSDVCVLITRVRLLCQMQQSSGQLQRKIDSLARSGAGAIL